MTTTNSQAVLIAGRAYLYLAPTGTSEPTDITTAMSAVDAAWVPAGLFTPDSLAFTTEPQFEEVNSHQSDFPVRRFQTSDSATLAVDLQEWNADNIVAVFGGGSVSDEGGGVYRYNAPLLGTRTEVAAVVEVVDGTKNYRWVFPRCLQIEGVDVQLNKGQEARLPLRLAVLGGDATSPFYFLTDDPAVNPFAS